MTAEEYRALRQELGSQKKVAAALGIDYRTLQRREYGEFKITNEAEIALRYLLATTGLCAISKAKTWWEKEQEATWCEVPHLHHKDDPEN